MWLFQSSYLRRQEKRVAVGEGEITTDQKQRPEFMNERASVLESREEAKERINNNTATLQNLFACHFVQNVTMHFH
jgi:ribosomal protein L9